MSLTYARHDVFISAEKQVTLSALAHVGTWLESAGMSTALDAVVSTSAGGESALETRLGVDLRGNGSHGSGAGGGGGGHRDGRSLLEETMSRSRLPALCRDCLGLQDSIETRSACSITTSSDGSIPCRGDQGA